MEMKLVFFLPFYNIPQHDLVSWLPLSAPNLIGNIKKDFPTVGFSVIELHKLFKEVFTGREMENLRKDLYRFFKTNPTAKDLEFYEKYFKQIDKILDLGQYDHFLFSHYCAWIIGIKANMLFARYLKNKYPDKKIIFGGVYGFGKNYDKCSFEEFGYIDATVVGYGENSAKEILRSLLAGKKLKKLYCTYTPPHEVIENLPDYHSIIDLDKSRYNAAQLEKLYNIELPRSRSRERVLFIPYKFNIGCNWQNCAYCRQSYGINFKPRPAYYTKDHQTIISELKYLKKTYKSDYFIFKSNNFNISLGWCKKLLSRMIDEKLDILWSDSFNLSVIDDELLEMLAAAGCFRMDLGVTTLNPNLQKMYNNRLQDNGLLENLKKISSHGIWTHINLIVNLPFQYSIDGEIETLKKYIAYIDGVAINNYRRTPDTDISINYKKYKIDKIHVEFKENNKRYYLYYIENEFKGGLELRKKMFAANHFKMINFFKDQGLINTADYAHLYLLGYLYKQFGFKEKTKIKRIITEAKPKY